MKSEFNTILGVLIALTGAGIWLLCALARRDESSQPPHNCTNCRHKDLHGVEDPCIDCVMHFPKMPKWEAEHAD